MSRYLQYLLWPLVVLGSFGCKVVKAQMPPTAGYVTYQGNQPSGPCSYPSNLIVVNTGILSNGGVYQCIGSPSTWQKVQQTTTGGGATFPDNPSIVKSTSSTASVSATGADLTALIGTGVYDPSGAASAAQTSATAAFTGDVSKTSGSFATTVSAVHATSGTLDGVVVGGVTPAQGNFSGVSVGTSVPAACDTATGCWAFTEAATAGTPTVNQCYIRADSVTNKFQVSCNHAAEAPIVTATAPHVTILTAGTSGTYTTPPGVIALRVTAIGCAAGGGGSGMGAGDGGNCSTANTTFGSSIVAGYGQGGSGFFGQGGIGGTATGGDENYPGNPGVGSQLGVATANGNNGGSSGCGGGAGQGGLAQGSGAQADGGAGQAPGAAGGGAAADGTPMAGPGGGGGGCVKKLITSPLATYAYQVGPTSAGGAPGTGGATGGDGAGGQILIEEDTQ